MRHDAERPQTTGLITEASVPGHWIQLLATMRADVFTSLSLDEVRDEAAHILIVSPTAEVARTCFADLLASTDGDEFVETLPAEEVVPADVPAGTWVFHPHRQDGWTELETTSATVRAALVKENTARTRDEKLTLIEYGVNLWLWAQPPYVGGDPVCHAGELISWESAWALSGIRATDEAEFGTSHRAEASHLPDSAPTRPPIYFGLPPVLRSRRNSG